MHATSKQNNHNSQFVMLIDFHKYSSILFKHIGIVTAKYTRAVLPFLS